MQSAHTARFGADGGKLSDASSSLVYKAIDAKGKSIAMRTRVGLANDSRIPGF